MTDRSLLNMWAAYYVRHMRTGSSSCGICLATVEQIFDWHSYGNVVSAEPTVECWSQLPVSSLVLCCYDFSVYRWQIGAEVVPRRRSALPSPLCPYHPQQLSTSRIEHRADNISCNFSLLQEHLLTGSKQSDPSMLESILSILSS